MRLVRTKLSVLSKALIAKGLIAKGLTCTSLTFTSISAGLVVSLATSAVQAGAIDQLKEFASKTKVASGEFVQTQIKKGGRTDTLSGVFSFSRPGKFRWEIRKPYEQLLVGDGEKAWFFDKDLNQVTVRKMGDALGGTPAAILFGSNDLDKDFTLVEAPARAGLEWLDATPKSRESSIEKMSLGFMNGLPQTIEVKDTFGQTSVVTLKNVQRNAPLDAGVFKFVLPKGADVVEQ